MQISAAPPVSPAVSAAAQPAPDSGDAGPVREGVADTLRAGGAGLNHASSWVGVSFDKAMIVPTEAFYQAGAGVKNADRLPDVVQKYGSKALNAGGLVTGFATLIYGGMMRQPGAVGKELLSGVADKIDGGDTAKGLYPWPVVSTKF